MSPVIETDYVWPVFTIVPRAISYLLTTLGVVILLEHIGLL